MLQIKTTSDYSQWLCPRRNIVHWKYIGALLFCFTCVQSVLSITSSKTLQVIPNVESCLVLSKSFRIGDLTLPLFSSVITWQQRRWPCRLRAALDPSVMLIFYYGWNIKIALSGYFACGLYPISNSLVRIFRYGRPKSSSALHFQQRKTQFWNYCLKISKATEGKCWVTMQKPNPRHTAGHILKFFAKHFEIETNVQPRRANSLQSKATVDCLVKRMRNPCCFPSQHHIIAQAVL